MPVAGELAEHVVFAFGHPDVYLAPFHLESSDGASAKEARKVGTSRREPPRRLWRRYQTRRQAKAGKAIPLAARPG